MEDSLATSPHQAIRTPLFQITSRVLGKPSQAFSSKHFNHLNLEPNVVVLYHVVHESHQISFPSTYSPAGRAYPDLAAQGTSYQVVFGGKIVSVNGTSASSPVCNLSATRLGFRSLTIPCNSRVDRRRNLLTVERLPPIQRILIPWVHQSLNIFNSFDRIQ